MLKNILIISLLILISIGLYVLYNNNFNKTDSGIKTIVEKNIQSGDSKGNIKVDNILDFKYTSTGEIGGGDTF